MSMSHILQTQLLSMVTPTQSSIAGGLLSDAAAVLVMQNAQQVSQVDCDAQLSAVFQTKSVKMSSLGGRINPHLRLVEPLTLRYTVRRAPLRCHVAVL